MACYFSQYCYDSANLWIYLLVYSSDFALRATTGQEGWHLFCHVVYPLGKPENFRSCVTKGSK